MKKKIGIIIQARLGSKRFPNKIIKKINKKTILEFLINRLKKIKFTNNIIIATSNKKNDKKIIKIAEKNNIDYYCGSENDVLDRYFCCAKKFDLTDIIRITSDCPFSDPLLINEMYIKYSNSNFDYLSNVIKPTFPDGLDVEFFNFKTLKKTWQLAKTLYEREHVTNFMINSHNIKKFNYKNRYDLSMNRITLDTPEDLIQIKKFYFSFKNPKQINYLTINKKFLDMKKKNKQTTVNHNFLWDKAKKKILNGNMLLSKNPEIILPTKWPTYFSKTNKINVWDLNNRIFLDCLMLVGTNVLGYNYPQLQKEIINTIQKGNISSFNCPEEVELAEKLIELHPWSSFTKFAKTGGEINLIALRIARANTKKQNVAFCGYHGWHDWYLSANLTNEKNLNNHLFENISTVGIPKNLKNTVYQFNYGKINELIKLIKKNSIGIVIMEFARIKELNIDFLKSVKRICKKYNCILIFDECTSGFREHIGGVHMKYKIEPDIVTFGKAIGNGYPITCLLAKEKLRNKSEKAFISSTNWSDRIGFVAANKTIEIMKQIKSNKIIEKLHNNFCQRLKQIALKNKLKIKIIGLVGIPVINFINKDNELIKNFITQEMLKKNILASNCIYLSIFHNNSKMKKYYDTLDTIFKIIKKEKNLEKLIEQPLTSKKFYRLN